LAWNNSVAYFSVDGMERSKFYVNVKGSDREAGHSFMWLETNVSASLVVELKYSSVPAGGNVKMDSMRIWIEEK